MREKFWVNLDVGVSGAVLRVLLGGALVGAVRLLPGRGDLATAAASLAAMLFGVKLFAAVARRAVRTSPAVAAHWEWRRSLARYYDSYQWRKLAWYGLGMLGASRLLGAGGAWEVPLGTACVLSGAVAEIFWRRKGLPLAPPVRG